MAIKLKTFLLTYALVSMVRLLMSEPSRITPEDPTTRSLLMYDGVCNLCNGFVNFVADHDKNRKVIFGSQQENMELLEKIGAPTDLSTLILVQGDTFYLYSAAALRTFALLDQPYRSLAAAHVLPEWIRDAGYKLVARHRYRVFGRSETCRTPDPDFKSRFLGYDALNDEDNKFVQDVMTGGLQVTKSDNNEL
mmetsp:Transcript_3943/g.5691  ORF Transcript_3943/g.5691 Transcript_3943/m.5691 type:complete len:193 (+) Transcript_3943:51-629(+)|eukprot:CAMPEP_0194250632 /NCGR_PEP_ID=MMETSP0158-20130606/23581_1 /TAXON_ID=33649 /ORGANISM="Thalassionema nitzschioides, Strain L26-B" /LENGTH=192 /DNA_ID=CAMNT_0038987519 /DNA_START=71 /DNA_END=649 /DNA_ORIENTATION=-